MRIFSLFQAGLRGHVPRLLTPLVGVSLLATSALVAPRANAAVPTRIALEGALRSGSNTPVADGAYKLTFRLYKAKTGGSAVWSEGPVSVTVKAGALSYQLGTSKALTPKLLAGLSSAWLGIQVGTDPELPRQPVLSTAYALVAGQVSCSGCISGAQLAKGGVSAASVAFPYAGSKTKGGPAVDVACTACVSVSELKFDGNVDLKGNSLKAKNGTFTGNVAANLVTATQFIGDGSKLTGIKVPGGQCSKKGEVVKGINPDGSLKCVAAVDPTALPADGLNEVANGLLTNQFNDTIAGQGNVAIPDNTGKSASSQLQFPDLGTAQKLTVTVDVSNSDLSGLSLRLLPPNDKKTGYVLCDPCGPKDSKTLKKSYPMPTKPKGGDLTSWVGKNPKGQWTLVALDTKFCVKQAAGNAALCDLTKKTDGRIKSWSIATATLSTKKVASTGDFVANKDVVVAGKGLIQRFDGSTMLYTMAPTKWERLVSGTSYKPVRDLSLTVDLPEPSLVIASVAGHVSGASGGNPWVYFSFFFDGKKPVEGDWYNFHLYRAGYGNTWGPLTLTQMYTLPAGRHVIALYGKSSGTFSVNGAGLQVAVLPRWGGKKLGFTAATAGRSCLHIKGSNPAAKTGVYWITANDTLPPTKVVCDMTTRGGGWTLLMKHNGDCTFDYDSAHWKSATTLNPSDYSLDAKKNAKYAPFNTLAVTEFRAHWQSPAWEIGAASPTPMTALQRFQKTENLGMGAANMHPSWPQQAGFQQYGFSLSCHPGMVSRWGWMFNNEGDCNSNDVAFGIGLKCIDKTISAGGKAYCCTSNGKDGYKAAIPVFIWGR